jgi:hypothetical protein
VTYPELHTGISVFDSVDHVRLLLRQTPLRGLIAELVIPDDAQVRIAKTLGRGHYTLWGGESQRHYSATLGGSCRVEAQG